jgi:hypothetical protein
MNMPPTPAEGKVGKTKKAQGLVEIFARKSGSSRAHRREPKRTARNFQIAEAQLERGAVRTPPRLESRIGFRAGQIDLTHLFACSAGVHVDFHANWHFSNLRSFPAHPNLL